MKKIDCSPYPVVLHITTDMKAFYKRRKAINGFTDSVEGILGMCSRNAASDIMIIGLFSKDASVLVHEVSHAVINIFEAVSMDVNQHTTEAFAYLFESIYTQCSKYLDKEACTT